MIIMTHVHAKYQGQRPVGRKARVHYRQTDMIDHITFYANNNDRLMAFDPGQPG